MKWLLALLALSATSFYALADTTHYIRYSHLGKVSYGKLVNDTIYPLEGDVFTNSALSSRTLTLSQVEVLLPTQPEKVFAVGMNFASHMSSPSDQAPPLFLKLPSSLILSGSPINVPQGASNVHFEGELVIVIGKTVRNIPESEAESAIFGVTVGNDITERNWQGSDLQWMRAKATDGFGPIGKTIVRGVDYNNVLLTTRLNGKVVQQENTRNMIHSPAKVVSYLSQYFTLKPGDLIFMGTPGRTQALKDKDVVSVSIDGIGEVSNQVRF
ncbi:fumarylacetoacetate hydrolase family protein [Vibrio paucivorans]|uniref:Fumarylacetoacetate hydrolase family protein n=1 Tax=Vibrio paucivorans TaxID=2829489 RepID=A0A9X3CGD0_9VIBR|nr:fumarylacetoacetate hydrolase family protein [Vibrio paucivorans]MCW8335271.1 fumarylacetoacetate hydrolase family protein [Vibrio paucivorans]